MRYDDEFEVRRPAHPAGTSAVWQIVAVVAILAAAVLLALSLGLGATLVAERRQGRGAPIAGGKPPAGGQILGEDDDGQEPANPPYPVVQDMRPAGPPVVPGEDAEAAPKTPRQRFLALAQEAWEAPEQVFPQDVRVSPDGQQIAYVDRQMLLVGPMAGEAQEVDLGGPAAPPGRRWPARPAPGSGTAGVVGAPSWWGDSQRVCFADSEGGLRRYDVRTRAVEALPFHGDSPVAVPSDPDKVVFRRSRPAPKVDLPGSAAAPDPQEVVLGTVTTGDVRVLLPASTTGWTPLAVSPDGKRLALSAPAEGDDKQPPPFRLFVLDLTAERPAEPKRLGRPYATLGPVSWAPDGKSLVCAHSQNPLPPDCWDADGPQAWPGVDLFHLDTDTEKQVRLSRGGGFGSPALAADGTLFFLVWQQRANAAAVATHLQRLPLAAALDFAANEPDRAPRDRQAWAKLIDDTLDDARVPRDADGEALPPEVLARVADGFARLYKERFRADAPASAAGWERQQRELRALAVPEASRPRFALVLGAAQGEYLRRRHGATWYMGAGPLVPAQAAAGQPDETNPFGLVLNPFQAVRGGLAAGEQDEEESGGPTSWLGDALVRARGRTLLLTNDPAAAKEALKELADPDLARARDLFEDKKGAEADRLLLDLVGRKKHADNAYLVLHVGKLLYEHGRLDALRKLLEPRADLEPRDEHRYNLLGLALLESDPNAAVQQFKNALRCNLYYGPGWLNLAQAYAKANDRTAAVQCLRHYLRIMPYGPEAGDTRQRLAALQADGGAAAPGHP
jgi:tetratricopeptide (TPR) repeat protein